MKNPNRITIFAGHYGSGKTNLAANYAVYLKKSRQRVAVVDLDIVNPYFRTKDAEQLFLEKGIALISSEYANSNVDVPSIPARANIIFDEPDLYSVVDLGGDDRGAYALGRYAEKLASADAAVLLVINRYRPLTGDPESVRRMRDEIEAAARVRFTGIVNNSNLGRQTQARHILDSLDYARECARALGLQLEFTAARRDLTPELGQISDLFPIDIIEKPGWNIF